MRILLTTLLLLCIWCFAKSQVPSAAALVNAHYCKTEACVDSALKACNYVKVKPDSVSGTFTFFVYKSAAPIAGEDNKIVVNGKYYTSRYITKSKTNFAALKQDFLNAGFEQQGARKDVNFEGRLIDTWSFGIPNNYTIFLGIDYFKKEDKYYFNLSWPH